MPLRPLHSYKERLRIQLMAQPIRDGNCVTDNHAAMNGSSMSGSAAFVICSIFAAIKLLIMFMLYIMLSIPDQIRAQTP